MGSGRKISLEAPAAPQGRVFNTEGSAGLKSDAALFLMSLVRCALDGRGCDQSLPGGVTWEGVLDLACDHGLDATAWFAVSSRDDLPGKVRTVWERRMQLAFFRRVRMDAEREAVFAELDQAGIAHMPLRGSLIAAYYPRPEMRTMADNDFLYGYVEPCPQGGFALRGSSERDRNRMLKRAMIDLRDIMVQRGYTVELLGRGNHDTYCKEPCFNFEPHRRLVSPESSYGSYYRNPWRFALPSEDGSTCFAMGASDEYVYTIVHAHKHVMDCGIGLRILADVRVFWEARGFQMDEAYMQTELAALGICEFEEALRGLASKLLGLTIGCEKEGEVPSCTEASLSLEERRLFAYLASSGSYGTIDQFVHNRLRLMAQEGAAGSLPEKGSSSVSMGIRARYTLRRLVGVDAMKGRSPFVVPFVAIGRLVRAVTVRRSAVMRELRLVWRRER